MRLFALLTILLIYATYNNLLWCCICLNSLPTKYCWYLLKLISIFGHFLTVNNRRYGCCYVKIFIPPCTFLEFYTQLEANSAKSFRNAFCKCSRALDIMFLKTSYFWWMSSFFSLSSHLKNKIRNQTNTKSTVRLHPQIAKGDRGGSQELVQKCLCIKGPNWNSCGNVVFWGEPGKTGEKTSQSRIENQQQTNGPI